MWLGYVLTQFVRSISLVHLFDLFDVHSFFFAACSICGCPDHRKSICPLHTFLFDLYIFLKYQIRPSAWKLDNLQIADLLFFFVKSILVKYRKMFIHINMTWPKFSFRISTNFRPEKTCTSLSKELGGMLFSVSDSITGVHMGLLLLGNIYFHCIWNICLAVSHRLSTETLLVLQQVARYQPKVCFSKPQS